MNYDLKKLMNKYNKSEEYGYITDQELLFLIAAVRHAADLSESLDAGSACTSYFRFLGYSISSIAHARQLDF